MFRPKHTLISVSQKLIQDLNEGRISLFGTEKKFLVYRAKVENLFGAGTVAPSRINTYKDLVKYRKKIFSRQLMQLIKNIFYSVALKKGEFGANPLPGQCGSHFYFNQLKHNKI